MAPCKRLYDVFKTLFLERSVQDGLIDLHSLSLAGDGTSVYTAARERKNVPVAASKTASGTAAANGSTASLTAASAGIPTGNAGISDMIYICLPPLIRTVTCLYFRSSDPLPDMTPLASFITGVLPETVSARSEGQKAPRRLRTRCHALL